MNNSFNAFREWLGQVRKVWIITAVVVLGLVVVVALLANGTMARAIAALNGKSAVAAVNTQALATSTMPAMPGMEATPTAMNNMSGMVMETLTPAAPLTTAPSGGSDLAALTQQMQDTMQSLQGMMTQLDQKSAGVAVLPTATPVTPAVDTQAIAMELQSINQAMGPLMIRIQADLQGNPSAEELASVRTQVEQITLRIGSLIAQIQAAQGNGSPVVSDPMMNGMNGNGMAGMPGMDPTQPAMSMGNQQDASQAMMTRLDQMMQEMQGILHQMHNQQTQAGNMSGQMSGMNMATPDPMAGMSSTSPSMDDMMMMMDNMMSMMDGMMSMSNMNMATPTPMPSMSGSNSSMNSMMMDNMMMMMDNMMKMMDDMMNSSSSSGGMSGSGSGGGMMDMDMMNMPDM